GIPWHYTSRCLSGIGDSVRKVGLEEGAQLMSECLFCKIVSRTIPAALVYGDELGVAFNDINPQAPTHVLVIPRKHSASIAELQDSDGGLLGHLMLAGNKIAKLRGVERSASRFVAKPRD